MIWNLRNKWRHNKLVGEIMCEIFQSVIKVIDPQVQEFHKHKEGKKTILRFLSVWSLTGHLIQQAILPWSRNTSRPSHFNTLCMSHFPEPHWHSRSHDPLQIQRRHKCALSFDGRNNKLTFQRSRQNENVWPFAIYPVTLWEKPRWPSYLNLSPSTSHHTCFIFLPIIYNYSELY